MLAGDDEHRVPPALALAELDLTEGHWGSALEHLDLVEQLSRDSHPRLRSAALGLRSRVCWITGSWEQAAATQLEIKGAQQAVNRWGKLGRWGFLACYELQLLLQTILQLPGVRQEAATLTA